MAIILDTSYVRTNIGLLRVGQIVLGIIVLICIGVSDFAVNGNGFIYFTALSSLLNTLIILILYIVHLPQTGLFMRVPWSLLECIYCTVWAVCYFISMCVSIATAVKYKDYTVNISSCYGASAFFCALACVCYVCDAIWFYRLVRFHTTTASTTTASGGSSTVYRETHTVTVSSTGGKY